MERIQQKVPTEAAGCTIESGHEAKMEILDNPVQSMPIHEENYSHRGGGNYGIVLLCPNLIADRLV